jgi:hypothetical protein
MGYREHPANVSAVLVLSVALCLALAVSSVRAQQITEAKIKEWKAILDKDNAARRAISNRLPFAPSAPQFCVLQPPTPAASINVHRSLFVHDKATLEAKDCGESLFALRRTLRQLAQQALSAGATSDGSQLPTDELIFKELFDTQNPTPSLTLGAHSSPSASRPPCWLMPRGSTAAGTPWRSSTSYAAA